MPNLLARERSPYLLQHAANPVDWHAWNEEAFLRARAEDKPIFLSIGYSTCHWCHVMAHESFEDEAVAAVLNEHFVSIKVDREERPDVDRVYMMFVQATTGAGGWPMSVWLTPDLEPFFGGTYFPPSSRWGRPGFVEILEQLARAWRDDRADVVKSAKMVIERLREASGAGETVPDRAPVAGRDAIDEGVAAFRQAFDARHGGFGGAPKFPRPAELLFLLRAHAFTGDHLAREMALATLRGMAFGGIRDHIGGGFHRYSVDAEWRVPHFEKMLYDQAQLVLAYLEGFQTSGDPLYASTAEDTLEYVLRDLTSPEGAFYSAEDADSMPSGADGGAEAHHGPREGAFYVWTAGELKRALGEDVAAIASRRYGVEPNGNALADPQGEFSGQNILYVAQEIEDIAARMSLPVDEVMAALVGARQALFDARLARPRPHLDDKIIAAWNGLMIAAAARAGRVLVDSPRRRRSAEAAERAARWARAHLWVPERRVLCRRYRAGDAGVDGFCEDYGSMAWGAIELFQTTGAREWLDWAIDLTAAQTERFYDDRDGGWFSTTGEDRSVLIRLKEDYDGAEPAAASVTVQNLLLLGHLVSDSSLVARGRRTLERYGPGIGRVVRVMPFMVSNVMLAHAGGTQIVVVGPAGDARTHALERAAFTRYLPSSVSIRLSPEGAAEFADRVPWLAAMKMRDGEPTAYVCHNFACREPVTDAAALARQLDDAQGTGFAGRGIYLG